MKVPVLPTPALQKVDYVCSTYDQCNVIQSVMSMSLVCTQNQDWTEKCIHVVRHIIHSKITWIEL